MARIRTIKPEFFRHESLQDLEAANPGSYVMLVFAGLWGHCDSKGRFEWRPRQLKLDILPFLTFDMQETLRLLEDAGLLSSYEVDGKAYGEIPSFEKHQRLTGKEATEGEKHPGMPEGWKRSIGETSGKHRGSNGEREESQEGKGREEEGKRKGMDGTRASGETLGNAISAKPDQAERAEESSALLEASRAVWRAYSAAYFDRYGTEPVQNVKVRSQVKQFVARIGEAEAPLVAAFYVGHPDAFYTKKLHAFGNALADAEKLRTEWATNRTVTTISARQSERTGTNLAIFNEIMAERTAA